MALPSLGFYRGLVLGFAAVWLIPEKQFAQVIMKWH